MNQYELAAKFLSEGRNKDDRPLSGKATRMQRREDGIAIRYHETDVVLLREDGSVVLNSGGWKTLTTKERINEYLPSRWFLWQDKSVWYVGRGWSDTNSYIFQDCMVIHPDGSVTGAMPKEDLKELMALKKRAKKYTKDFIAALYRGEVPEPDAGDCWYCSMRVVGTNIPLGESSQSNDHIISHIEEGYYVPSLLVRALEVMPCSPAMQWAIGSIWQGDLDSYWAKADFLQEQIEKSLRRYVYQQLGLPSSN